MNNVSIIVTTLNSSGTIKMLLDSLSLQTVSKFDLIIIDGGSVDETLEFIQEYNNIVTTVKIEVGCSIYEGINFGLSICETDYYLVCGSDDVLFPNAIELILSEINSGFDLYIFSVFQGDKLVTGNKPNFINKFVGWQSIISSHSVGTIIKKSLHKELGNYDSNHSILADGVFISDLLNCPKYSVFVSNFVLGEFGLKGVSNSNFYKNIFSVFLIQCRYFNFYLQFLVLIFRLVKYKNKLLN